MKAQTKLIEQNRLLYGLVIDLQSLINSEDAKAISLRERLKEITSLDKQIAEGKENFTVDNFNHQRLVKEYDKPFDQSVIKMPTDYDIENAANEYADDNKKHHGSIYGKLHKAYKTGAKEMRDRRIYISPDSHKPEGKEIPANEIDLGEDTIDDVAERLYPISTGAAANERVQAQRKAFVEGYNFRIESEQLRKDWDKVSKEIPAGAEEMVKEVFYRHELSFMFNHVFQKHDRDTIIQVMEEYAQIKGKEALQSNKLKNE